MVANQVCDSSDKLIVNIHEQINIVKTFEEVEILRKNVNKCILLINKYIGNKNESENLMKLESNLPILKYFREKLKQLKHAIIIKTGSSIQSENKKLTSKLLWEDVKSGFPGGIKTGVIINKSFKDPKIFLEKCARIFKNKVKTAVKNSVLKVNTVLSVEFIIPHTGVLKVKTFKSQNEKITNYTNILAWYKEFVQDKILSKLEQFQLHDILHLKVHINKYTPEEHELQEGQSQRDVKNFHNKCNICCINDIEIAFLPCGHSAVCLQCVQFLQNCIICRNNIVNTARIFIC